ncbi:hypothetical protein K9U39_12345 [Rhodoblastus acidophilus]|uniref:O-antigen ligase family protein n=1 Tax=Candidatus Rhodoblastus alkanivorans TaxID=2954117 RepID=UPI001FAA6421|nr:hypothetical protein [Candidatus Rhodoblastus alkanivorans]MCI4677045.1 hypothetical protein [Candidatus Rhodoblastus alkanivorans]MDI4641719.1 hypothetical protein [Rhodoblastus acidophilus]
MRVAPMTEWGARDLAWPESADEAASYAVRADPPRRLVSWLALLGLVIPAWEAQISIADAKFTAGRFLITVLVVPALVVLARSGRRLMAADVAALFMAIWMFVSAASNGGSLSSPAAEALQMLFAYIVGRAFFSGPASLDAFVRTLATLTFFIIAIAIGEHVAGRWIAHDAAASIFGTTPLTPVYRGDTIRATSTLDHPILFGVFCALVNAILLLWEKNAGRRVLFSAICLLGCVLSQSSAALMAYVLGVAAYSYDRLMRTAPARWTLFWIVLGTVLGVVFIVSRHPIGWLISHLTLDPVTGYYRILIWDAALAEIGQSPITGFSFELFHKNILDSTVDCVWLVEALRYGIPASALLFCANIAAVWPARRRAPGVESDFDRRMNLAFAIVLLLFIFSGITVHFWNYMWIFWGLCIGIKASLRERAMNPDVSHMA